MNNEYYEDKFKRLSQHMNMDIGKNHLFIMTMQKVAEDALGEAICYWNEGVSGEGIVYSTSCNLMFDADIIGSPESNCMEFCCYCGKPLESVDYSKQVE